MGKTFVMRSSYLEKKGKQKLVNLSKQFIQREKYIRKFEMRKIFIKWDKMKIEQQNNETIFEIHPLGTGALYLFL